MGSCFDDMAHTNRLVNITGNPINGTLWDDGAQRVEKYMPGELKTMLRRPIDVGTPYNYSDVVQKPIGRPQVGMRELGVGPIDKPQHTAERLDHFAPRSSGPATTLPTAVKDSRDLQNCLYENRVQLAAENAAMLCQSGPQSLQAHRYRRLEIPYPRSSASFDARDAF